MTPTKYIDNLQALSRVVYGMERRGVPIDLEICADIAGKAETDEAESLLWLNDYAKVPAGEENWNYAQWLVELLHEKMKIAPSPYWFKGKVRLEEGERKTDARALEYMAAINPEHRAFLVRIQKLRRQHRMANYARGWIDLALPHPDGSHRLHPSFGMAFDTDDRPGAKTGRFGIKNPALQQVPRDKKKDPYRLRRAFIAPPGHLLVVADQTQLEIVILAHICVKLFGATGLRDRLAKGMPDLHSATAQYVFGEVLGNKEILLVPTGDIKEHALFGRFRDLIKAIRYGLHYGKTDWGFGNTLFELDDKGDIVGPPLGQERAGEMIRAMLQMDPELLWYQEFIRQFGHLHQMIPSGEGRWAPLPGFGSRDKWEVARAQKAGLNWPMQTWAQEAMAAMMVEIDRRGIGQSLQVHDEIHALVPEDRVEWAEKEMQDVMENFYPLLAPLQAKPHHGINWEQAK